MSFWILDTDHTSLFLAGNKLIAVQVATHSDDIAAIAQKYLSFKITLLFKAIAAIAIGIALQFKKLQKIKPNSPSLNNKHRCKES